MRDVLLKSREMGDAHRKKNNRARHFSSVSKSQIQTAMKTYSCDSPGVSATRRQFRNVNKKRRNTNVELTAVKARGVGA